MAEILGTSLSALLSGHRNRQQSRFKGSYTISRSRVVYTVSHAQVRKLVFPNPDIFNAHVYCDPAHFIRDHRRRRHETRQFRPVGEMGVNLA